jgi:hypothetical protein
VRRAAIPIEALIVERTEMPTYVRIADKAAHLRELGKTDGAIAHALRASDKTVTKSISRAASTSDAAGCDAGRWPATLGRQQLTERRWPRA